MAELAGFLWHSVLGYFVVHFKLRRNPFVLDEEIIGVRMIRVLVDFFEKTLFSIILPWRFDGMCWNLLIVGSNRSKKVCSLCSGWITPLSSIKIGLTSLNPQLTRR